MSAPTASGLLIVCSKSTWEPAIRREHALSQLAAAHGLPVLFLERPLDVRALLRRGARRPWVRAVVQRSRVPAAGTVVAVPTATIVPGHRGAVAQWADGRRLLADLRSIEGLERATVVATQPWQWPAVRASGAARVVFDCADDWGALVPRRRAAFEALQRRIGLEADAVTAVSGALRERFGGRIAVIPNGTSRELLGPPPVPPPVGARRLVYVGTLSERFDAPLMSRVLELLGDWSLDLYGPCQYAGLGSDPAPELERMLTAARGRALWHGVLARPQLAGAIDAAAVAVAPHRTEYTAGQDSMKLYDYAARSRVVVTTVAREGPVPAGILIAADADAFAASVSEAATLPEATLAELRSWAEKHSWTARWEPWRRAALDDRA